jgi:hypothetical protein
MAAQADGAFHVALHGHVDAIRGDARILQRAGRIAHHDLGTADQGDRPGRIKARAGYQRGHHTHVAVPSRIGMIDGDVDLDVEPAAPPLQFIAEENLVGPPHARQDDHAPVVLANPKQMVDRGPQRRESEAAGDHDDVAPQRLLHRPGAAIRAAHADDAAHLEVRDRGAHGADRAHGVHDAAAIGRITAQADRDLAPAEGIEHVELAG